MPRPLRHVLPLALAALLVSALLSGPVASASGDGQPAVVAVQAPTDAARRALWAAGLDLVEVGPTTAEVWLHGPADRALLEATGLAHTVLDTSGQQQRMAADRAAEATAQSRLEAGQAEGSALPTGRMAYRTLEEITDELATVAAANPDRVQLFTLPEPSLLGRPVLGVEVAADVAAHDGRPVFLLTGVHHAREWPTAELTMEFLHDVLAADGTDPRITGLLADARLVIVPVVNPDGYDVSRRLVHEQKRKNCRVRDGEVPTQADCDAASASAAGVDLNRNYGPFWNGPGTGSTQAQENYRGEAPYSEPEIRNIAALTASHQVTVAIHNHTPDGRLLRAPSSPEEPEPREVEVYDGLAQQLGAVLGWPAGPWTEIYYVASGVAEEQAFYTQNILAFTPEATPGHEGLERFHPPYQAVVEQYTGTGQYEGSHIREAFVQAWEAAADPDLHGVLQGTAPPGIALTLHKAITVETSCAIPGEVGDLLTCPTGPDGAPLLPVQTLPQEITTTMVVPADGMVEWHVGPSLRPDQRTSALLEEAWTLTCGEGDDAVSTDLVIGRGEVVDVELSACPGPAVSRLAGPDRYGTAAAVASASPGMAAFVATGTAHPDAMAVAAVAAIADAPVLLTMPDAVPVVTEEALADLSPSSITVLGGTAAVTAEVEDDLADHATVARIAGPDRGATAAAISRTYLTPGVDTVVVATRGAPHDALVAGPLAARLGGPLLLVTPDTVPTATAEELDRLDPARILIVGDEAAVGDAVEAALADHAAAVDRVAGSGSVATAIAAAQAAFPDGAGTVHLASADSWVDALAGAAAAARAGSPLLLVGPTLGTAVAEELSRLSPARVVIVGGPAAVPTAVEDEVAALLAGG